MVPLVHIKGEHKTEISAVKVNWSILVGLGKSTNQVFLHKEAVDSYFKLISSWKVAEISIFLSK